MAKGGNKHELKKAWVAGREQTELKGVKREMAGVGKKGGRRTHQNRWNGKGSCEGTGLGEEPHFH